jgi:hypothetical protein
VAPIILGAGRASFTLPPLQRLADVERMPMHAHALDANSLGAKAAQAGMPGAARIGTDVLLDCDLSAQRMVIGRAKMSM